MKIAVKPFAAMALVAQLCACAPADPETGAGNTVPLSEADAMRIVTQLIEEWDVAVLSGDVETAAGKYTEDAIRMQPDLLPLVGREAIQAWLHSQSDLYTFEGSNEIDEVTVLGPDWILFRTTGAFTASPKDGGEPVHSHGKWLSIVQRQADGSWEVFRAVGNSNPPPAQQ